MSLKLRTCALAAALTCSSAAHATQPKGFAIRCTTAAQAQADSMSHSVSQSVHSTIKPNIFGAQPDDTGFEDKRKAAIASLRSASVVVFGHDPVEGEYEGWLLALQHDPKFYDDYFDFTQGVTFLKSCLRTFAGETFMEQNGQEQTIDAAFWQARGRAAGVLERNVYLPQIAAGTAWYATIVLAEKQKVAAGQPSLPLPPGGLPKLPPQTRPTPPKP